MILPKITAKVEIPISLNFDISNPKPINTMAVSKTYFSVQETPDEKGEKLVKNCRTKTPKIKANKAVPKVGKYPDSNLAAIIIITAKPMPRSLFFTIKV